MPVELGLSASVALTVGEVDTAVALRSGDVATLGTPRVVALCEEAAVKAVDGRLQPDETTVGIRIQLDHLAPSAVGQTIVAAAKLERVEGRRLSFAVSVNDDRGLVAAGRVMRVLVNRERFLDRLR